MDGIRPADGRTDWRADGRAGGQAGGRAGGRADGRADGQTGEFSLWDGTGVGGGALGGVPSPDETGVIGSRLLVRGFVAMAATVAVNGCAGDVAAR